MAAKKNELATMVGENLAGTYKTTKPRSVPEPADISLGQHGAELEATALFIDIRQSSDITNSFRRQTAAKMLKAYFRGAVTVINANGGRVRSFNGDGMLALFIGDLRSSGASKAAMETKWFVKNILGPKCERYFQNNRSALGQNLGFSIGCGLDDGYVYAVRVGIRGTNDVAWVGRCTNTAAKLSNILQAPQEIAATREVYKRLPENRRTSTRGTAMWTGEKTGEFGGVSRYYRTSHFGWVIH